MLHNACTFLDPPDPHRPSTHWPKPTLIPYSLDMIATYCNNLYPLCWMCEVAKRCRLLKESLQMCQMFFVQILPRRWLLLCNKSKAPLNVTFASMQPVHSPTGIQSSKPVAELPLLPNATALHVGSASETGHVWNVEIAIEIESKLGLNWKILQGRAWAQLVLWRWTPARIVFAAEASWSLPQSSKRWRWVWRAVGDSEMLGQSCKTVQQASCACHQMPWTSLHVVQSCISIYKLYTVYRMPNMKQCQTFSYCIA